MCEAIEACRERLLQDAVRDACQKKEGAGVSRIRRGRMALVGRARDGKSSTLSALCGEGFAGYRESTPGADICEIDVSVEQIGGGAGDGDGAGSESGNAVYRATWAKAEMGRHRYQRNFVNHLPVVDGKIAFEQDRVEALEKLYRELEDHSGGAAAADAGNSSSKIPATDIQPNVCAALGSGSGSGSDSTAAGAPEAGLGLPPSVSLSLVGSELAREVEQELRHTYRLSVWDFAGQRVFRILQTLYVHETSCFVIVFNLKDMMSDDPKDVEYALEDIVYWVQTIMLHSGKSKQQQQQQGTPQTSQEREHAPIVLVGTHYDKAKESVSSSDQDIQKKLEEVNQRILSELGWDKDAPAEKNVAPQRRVLRIMDDQPEITVNGGKIFHNQAQDLCFWPVDNSNPKDENIAFLRGFLRDVAVGEDHTQDLVPISWQRAIDKLALLSEDEAIVPLLETQITKTESYDSDDSDSDDKDKPSVMSILRKCNALSDENEEGKDMATMIAFLNFCHKQGMFTYFDDIKGNIQKHCLLRPQWIVSMATFIIRDFKYHRFSRDYDAMKVENGKDWKMLLRKGILSIPLLQKFWGGTAMNRVTYALDFFSIIGLFGDLPKLEDGKNRILVSTLVTRTSTDSTKSRKTILAELYGINKEKDKSKKDGSSRSVPKNLDDEPSQALDENIVGCTKSITFQPFLPTVFYNRMLADLVRMASRRFPPPGQTCSAAPIILRHGCVLYVNGCKDDPYGIHLNVESSSIDIIVTETKTNLFESIIPEIEDFMFSINREFYRDRLEIDYPPINTGDDDVKSTSEN